MAWWAPLAVGAGSMLLDKMINKGDKGYSTEQLPQWTPEQAEMMKKIMGWGGESFGQPGAAYPGASPYGSNLSQLSLSGLEAMFGPAGLAESTSEQLKKTIEGGPQDFEEYYQKSVYDPMVEQFKEDILPSIGASAGSAYWSSGRLGQEEAATEDLLKSLTGERAKLAYESRESALNRSLQAIGLAPQMTQMYGEAMGIGAAPGTWEYVEWQRQQEDFYKRLALILQALGIRGSENIVSPDKPSFLESMAPGIGYAAGSALAGYGWGGVSEGYSGYGHEAAGGWGSGPGY